MEKNSIKELNEEEIWQNALQNAYDGVSHFEMKKVIKDDDGNLVLVDKTEEEILNGYNDEKITFCNSKIDELQKVLDDSDWYVIRKNETGENIPEDVITLRQECRDKISTYRKILSTVEE